MRSLIGYGTGRVAEAYLVGTGVFLRWFVDRQGFEHARRLQADRLEQAADLAARKMLRMYDALFVQLAIERKLPLLTTDVKLSNAASGLVEIELLSGAAPS